MSAPRVVSGAVAPYRAYSPASTKWTARQDRLPQPKRTHVPYTRRYEITWLDDEGLIQDFTRVAPAAAEFEAGFSAFSHGALISTSEGPVAVEDLVPGMLIETTAGAAAKLRWIGAMTIIPGGPERGGLPDKLYRVVADSLGLGRPASDVTLGPGARILDRSPDACAIYGTEAVLRPASSFADGEAVVEITPVAPIRTYHLSFDAHHVIYANKVEVESFHPGPETAAGLSDELQAQFVSLFPHKHRMQDFGRMLWPRLGAADPLA